MCYENRRGEGQAALGRRGYRDQTRRIEESGGKRVCQKIVAKDLLGPLTGESSEIIPSEPGIGAVGFAPTMIGFGEDAKVVDGTGGKGGSSIGRNSGRGQAMNISGMGGRKDGDGMAFVGPKERGG
jgi:hypothetical protein